MDDGTQPAGVALGNIISGLDPAALKEKSSTSRSAEEVSSALEKLAGEIGTEEEKIIDGSANQEVIHICWGTDHLRREIIKELEETAGDYKTELLVLEKALTGGRITGISQFREINQARAITDLSSQVWKPVIETYIPLRDGVKLSDGTEAAFGTESAGLAYRKVPVFSQR